MLQAIRDRVTGVVAFVILGLLAIPFLFFGVDSYLRDVPQDAIATVGDSEITLSEFQTEFARYRAQLRAQQGEAYDDLASNQPQARREFLDNMIDQRLLVEHANQLGLGVSPATLVEVIRGIPAFQIDGRFDPEVYRQRVQASGQSPAAFERTLSRDLLVQELPAAISSSTVVTRADVDRRLRFQLETRRIASVEIDSAGFRDDVSVSDQQVLDFYEENAVQFMRPERVSVEYLELDTRDMAETIALDEEEIEQRYEATKARFMTPERRQASHILIAADGERSDEQARELAESLASRIADGEDFEALAREYSDDPGSAGQGGDLGWIEPAVMMPEFEDALYGLEEGGVSDPVETEFGWHLIRLDAIDPPRGQTLEEARPEIAAEIREERADDMYIELSDRLVDLVYADPTGLDAVANDLGLELKSAGPFSRFGAEGVLANPQVMEAIFSDLVLLDRQASEPIELDRNHALVVRVTEHQPSEPRPLDDVEGEIRDRLARRQALEAAREYGNGLIDRISGDATMAEVASDEGLSFQEREVTRRSFELGGDVLNEIFEMAAPSGVDQDSVFKLVPRNSGWLLVRLDEVIPGDAAAADEAQRQSARQQIRFARSTSELQGLLHWLRENTEISVAADRI